jgi:hypothetical protein
MFHGLATGSQAVSKARKSAFTPGLRDAEASSPGNAQAHAAIGLGLCQIVCCGDEDGVDGIACGAGEGIVFKQAIGFGGPIAGSVAFRPVSSRLILGEVMPRVWAM